MFICDDGQHCCNWVYADTLDQIEGNHACGHLIEVAQVIHAHWIKVSFKKYPDEYKFQCSKCKTNSLGEHNYCPNCGARMDESNE